MESKIRISATFFLLLYSFSIADDRALSHLNSDNLNESFGDVIYAQILFRHGDRTPDSLYPTDPNQSFEWKEGNSQLTKTGKRQAYELGKWIRQHYAALMADKPYRYDAIMVNSSDVDRTLMSAETFLAGMYPPGDKEMWNNENLRWQPIPVHSTLSSLDIVLVFESRPCKRYDEEKDKLNQSPEIQAFYEKHRHVIEYVSNHSGVPMSGDDVYNILADFENIYDTLTIESEYNLTIPSWAQSILPEPMKSIADFHYSMLAPTRAMQIIKGGPLLKTMIDDMKKKVNSSLENRTFHIYSGHSKGVATLLETLEIFDGVKPPYAAAVIVELRKKEDIYFVSVLYRNSSLVAPYLLRIPGCEKEVCTLDEFIRVTALKISDHWEFVCEGGAAFFLEFIIIFSLYLGVGVLGLGLVLLLFKGIILSKPYMLRKYEEYSTIRKQADPLILVTE